MFTRLWAEVGIWDGQAGLIIQREEYEPDWRYREFSGPLLDVPIDGNDDDSDVLCLPWREPLLRLGYRPVPGWEPTYLPDSVCFPIEEV
jgi:hypothetical protein